MHDDEGMKEPFESPEPYGSEAEWEKHLLENEKLVDRYEKIWNENPERRWEDPVDLYFKVHYGIDLGGEIKEISLGEPSASEESESEKFADDSNIEEKGRPMHDELKNISAYRWAFNLALEAHDYLKALNAEDPENDAFIKSFAHHAFRIAADIAGGDGLGYEEDALCGNIIKNR